MTHKVGANKKRTQTAQELKAIRLKEIKTLGLQLKKEGLPFRKIHEKIEEKYKISYKSCFDLLKDEDGK
ncbi:MAG: hypothetical protein ACI81I_000074 [Arcobacteraceae bacterium]|jgi:hypothetical protein